MEGVHADGSVEKEEMAQNLGKRKNISQKAAFAAITAAVMNYLKTEEEAAMVAAMAATRPAAISASSLYGAYGRQQMMEMRRLLSLRLVR